MNFPYFLSIEVFISTLLMKFALENKEEKMWKMFLVFGGFAKKNLYPILFKTNRRSDLRKNTIYERRHAVYVSSNLYIF